MILKDLQNGYEFNLNETSLALQVSVFTDHLLKQYIIRKLLPASGIKRLTRLD